MSLEPELAEQIEALAHRRGLSFEQAMNEVVRRGLTLEAEPSAETTFHVRPHASEFRAGIDPGKLNQLLDQLEVEDFIAKARR